ncbi:NAD(P)-binding domain-containing protein [Gynuella sp.]|uniref:NAD(P)-binding domain-containing protein n=1 Tax=Gynuella sp. TaxID=2969146 RepID=UPI003D146FCD
MLDFAIIGAGPAGLQMAYCLNNKCSYEVFEKSDAIASSFSMYPRHRKLISINKRFTGSSDPDYNLRHDWNSLLAKDGPKFTDYDKELFPNADSMCRYLEDFKQHHGLNVSLNCGISKIEKSGAKFRLTLENGRVKEAACVIVATGLHTVNVPDIPGIEHAEQYANVSIDSEKFENKRVLIIGKGNSAFESADHIAGSAALIHLCSPEPLQFAWKTHYVGHLRAVNNNILDMYQLKSQHALLDARISAISPTANHQLEVTLEYCHAENEIERIVYDSVICCAGFKLDTSIFARNCMPDTQYNGKYPSLTHSFESSNISNLYFAGTLMHGLDYQKSTSGFIHGFRYNVKAMAQILLEKFQDVAPPESENLLSKSEVLATLFKRINSNSGLWQQPAFLADFFVFKEQQLIHHQDMPKQYGLQKFNQYQMIALTFEYGIRCSMRRTIQLKTTWSSFSSYWMKVAFVLLPNKLQDSIFQAVLQRIRYAIQHAATEPGTFSQLPNQ